MKNRIAGVGLAFFALVFAYFFFRSRNDVIVVDGKKYEFVIYEITSPRPSLSRADTHPKVLELYPWVGPASLSYGAAFMNVKSSEELNGYFETPPPDVKKGVAQILSNTTLEGEISVVSAEKYLIGKEWYLLLGLTRSDFPKGVKYSKLIERNGKWVLADGARDPDGNIIKLLSKIRFFTGFKGPFLVA